MAIKEFKKAFKKVFADDVVLERIEYQSFDKGYFQMVYMYLPQKYYIEIENEMVWFNIRLKDEEGAFNSLYGIKEYDNMLNPENIRIAVSLLRNVLNENEFAMYLHKGEKLYKKMGEQLKEIDIKDM